MKLSIDMSRAGGPATGLIPCIPATTQPGGGIPLKTHGGRAPARPSCRPGPICDRNPIPSCPGSADATPGRCIPPEYPSAMGFGVLEPGTPPGHRRPDRQGTDDDAGKDGDPAG